MKGQQTIPSDEPLPLRAYRVHLRGGNLPLVRVLGTDPDDACKVAVEMFGGEAFDVGSCPLPLP